MSNELLPKRCLVRPDVCRCGNWLIRVVLVVYLLLIPALLVLWHLRDPHLSGPGTPELAVRLHRALSPRYERWAQRRIESVRAAELTTKPLSGTEWPLFGSVFYLWATESLEDAWQEGERFTSRPPSEYAAGAVEAATDLVLDPGHAHWVIEHWGDDYMNRENAFYRMLRIAAMTSHHRITGDDRHLDQLRREADALAAELDASPHGLLDDFPDQCYPGDVLAAIAMIRRADRVVGTDHGPFADRALRGFRDQAADVRGMPPYAAMADTGQASGPSRGCSNSYICLLAPELWPPEAAQWYTQYERHFWQRRWGGDGFREFPHDLAGGEWYFDVDAGPVIAGHGIAARAFGLGAARVNGRFDHAYPLTAELLALSLPLPHGTLAGPRLLSNAADAPYLGEAAIVYLLTRSPDPSVATIRTGGSVPPVVWCVLAIYIGISILTIALTIREYRRWRRRSDPERVPLARAQLAVWLVLLIGAAVAIRDFAVVALILLLMAQLLPRGGKFPKCAPSETS